MRGLFLQLSRLCLSSRIFSTPSRFPPDAGGSTLWSHLKSSSNSGKVVFAAIEAHRYEWSASAIIISSLKPNEVAVSAPANRVGQAIFAFQYFIR